MATKKSAPAADKSIESQIADKRAELLETRKSHRAGDLVNPRKLGELKKDIARLLTKANQAKEGK